MDRRRRAQAAAAVALTVLLTACANDPTAYPHGDLGATDDLSALRTIAVYVLVPALILGGLAAASWLFSRGQGSRRYRPQEGWSAAPVWFAGPSGDAVAAVEQADAGDVTRGGTGGNW